MNIASDAGLSVLITGATGFIGVPLCRQLLARGARLMVLTRDSERARQRLGTEIATVTQLDQLSDEVPHTLINLAGEPLASGRWSAARKEEFRRSRIGTTEALWQWFGQRGQYPQQVISGSAIGWYGDSLTAGFTEDSPPGAGFAADLCQQWESAALAAEPLGVRVVLLRLGVVFGRDGGALTEMLRSFRFGVGSWVGSGRQWLSWVHRRDVVESILFLLTSDDASGAFNVTAPRPVTHRDFAAAAAERKPTLFSAAVPGPLLRAMVGEMAEELLLKGQRVLPERLEAAGYNFRFASLEAALADILGRSSGG